jgi:ribosome-associated toxin RatA of RatAB toxin-antitoxin module
MVLRVRFCNTVSALVDCSVDRVLRVLHKVEEYPDWWPTPVLWTGDGHGYLTVKPLPIVSIQMVLVTRSAGKVQFEYAKGPFRGTGMWTVEPGGRVSCNVSYTVDLVPVNMLAKIVVSTPLFRRKHESDIRHIIAALSTKAC